MGSFLAQIANLHVGGPKTLARGGGGGGGKRINLREGDAS